MGYSGSLAPRFVAAASLTAPRASSRGTRWVTGFVCWKHMWPPPIKLRALLLHHGCVWWVSHERKAGREACSGCGNQPGEGCDGCRVSQEGGCVQLCRVMLGLLLLLHWHRLLRQPEGINMSAAPKASGVSFRPLKLMPRLPWLQQTVPAV